MLRVDASTAYCLLEAHASFPGGLGKSLWAFQPQIGVVTRVGDDHFTNYRSREAVAREKGILMERLPQNGVGNVDNTLIADMAKRTRARLPTFGRSPAADLRALVPQA